MDYRASGPALASGDYARAASTMAAAAKLVPESTDLAEAAGLFQAINFLAEDKSTEALPLFQRWSRNHPEDDSIAGVRGGVSPADCADAEEDITRILYRLESRQIIDRAE